MSVNPLPRPDYALAINNYNRLQKLVAKEIDYYEKKDNFNTSVLPQLNAAIGIGALDYEA